MIIVILTQDYLKSKIFRLKINIVQGIKVKVQPKTVLKAEL